MTSRTGSGWPLPGFPPCNEETGRKLAEAIDYRVDVLVPNAYMMVSKAADNGQTALALEPEGQFAASINTLADKIIRWDDTGRGMQ